MRKLFLIGAFSLSLFGSGEEVYDNQCLSCHQKILSKEYVLKNIKTLKAPPMIEVIQNIKSSIKVEGGDEDLHKRVMVAFIRDYIKEPDMMTGFCSPFVYDVFGEMPSLKDKISDNDLNSVTSWIVEEFYEKEF
jgi:hypothetical protein